MPEKNPDAAPDRPTEPSSPSAGSTDWSLGSIVRRWFGTEAEPTDEIHPRYRLGEVLGRGGMGEVRMAHDRRLRRDVAIKTALTTDPDDVGRFLHEAQVTGQLAHPNIPPIHDLGLGPGGSVFFTMRALPGRSLSQVLRTHGALSVPRALEVFGKACDAVAYAHSKGVLHRDLKPGNLIVGDYGEVYVIDWGLAKRLSDTSAVVSDPDDSGEAFTRAGNVVGTPGYMSPEQATGDVRLDERADVYSLGAVLYALVTGQPPFPGSGEGVLLRVARGEFPPARRVRPELPWEIDQIVRKAMALRPEDRYRTVSELQADLLAWQEQRVLPGIRYGALRLAGRAVLRHRRWLLGSVVVGGAVGGLLVAVLMLYVVTLTLARDRAVAAERVAEGRSIDQQVALARVRAESGITGPARAELLDAVHRYQALGRDPITARLALSALDARWPPPEVRLVGVPLDGVALAPDADRVAVVSGREVSVHDLLTGARVSRWVAPEGAALRLVGWGGGHPRLLVRDGDRLGRFDALGQPLWSVLLPPGAEDPGLLSADERLLVVQAAGRSQVWSVPEGVPVGAPIDGTVVALSADGTQAVVYRPLGGKHRQVTEHELVDVATGEVLGRREGIDLAVYSPDLSVIVVPASDGVEAIGWDGVRRWKGPPVREPYLAPTPSGDGVVSFGTDGVVQQFELATGRLALQRRAGEGRQAGAGGPAVGHGWVGANVAGAFHVWSLVDRPDAPVSHEGPALALDVSPDGLLAATSGWEGDLLISDWRSQVELHRVRISDEGVRGAAFSPDGSRVATGDREGHVRVVDVASGTVSAPLDGPHGIAMYVRWWTDARVVVAYEDGTLGVWDVERGALVQTLHEGLDAAWGLDVVGNTAAVGGRGDKDPLGELWDLESGRRVAVLPETNAAYGAALAPDGSAWAVGVADGRVVALDRGEVRDYPAGTGGAVLSVAYSPDGRLVLAGTFAGTVVVYDRATEAELLTLERHDGGTQDLRFVPGTHTLLSFGGAPGTLAVFDTGPVGAASLAFTPGDDTGTPDLVGAADRAEARGDWGHAARALDTARALGTAVSATRLARVHLANGDRPACRRALPDSEAGVAPATLALLGRACAE